MKVDTNDNERILKIAFLNHPSNLVNSLVIRRGAFDLANAHGLNYSEALSLLVPRYFENRAQKSYDNLQGI